MKIGKHTNGKTEKNKRYNNNQNDTKQEVTDLARLCFKRTNKIYDEIK